MEAAAALVIALVPAAVRLWRDRALARRVDDPAFPERWLASRQRGSIWSGLPIAISTAALLVVLPRHAGWACPLSLIALIAAAFRLRKAMLGETWSLPAYFWFFGRLLGVTFGFWLLVAFAPAIIASAGERVAIAAATLVALLIGWNTFSGDVIRIVMRAKPIADPALAARLASLTERAGVAHLRWFHAPVRGGVFANAVAVPHVKRPSVIFTDTLLSRLDEDEVVGIAAHELAHIEHYTPRRLRTLSVVVYLFIAGAATLGLLIDAWLPDRAWLITLTWLVGVFSWLAALGRFRRRDETESDIRAAALTGDPESVVRALTKLHTIARLPRRWAAEFEERATHPSLARRIQAIRAHAGSHVEGLPAPVTALSAVTAASVTLHNDHLDWASRGATTTLPYAALVELRIQARAGTAARLLAVGIDGQRRVMRLRAADVGVIQRALDIVDTRLAPAAANGLVPAGLARAVALLLVVAALAIEYPAALFAALLATWQPASPLLTAAGLAGLIAGLVRLGTNSVRGDGADNTFALITLSSGALLLLFAVLKRREPMTPAHRRPIWVLGVGTALSLLPMVFARMDVVTMHSAARMLRPFGALPLAFAAAALWRPSWLARALALLSTVAGVIVLSIGTPQFVDSYSDDPFLRPGPEPSRVVLSGELLNDVTIDEAESVRLSPSGRAIAVIKESDTEEHHVALIGAAGGSLTPFDADGAVFVDDERVLLLATEDEATRIRLVSVAGSLAIWEHVIPDLAYASLSIDRVASRWQALGYGKDGEVARATGPLSGGTPEVVRWLVPFGDEGVYPLASHGDTVIVKARDWPDYAETMRFPSWWRTVRGLGPRTTFQSIGKSGAIALVPTALDGNCHPNDRLDAPPVCAAFDGSRTHIAWLGSSPLRLQKVMTLHGNVTIESVSGFRVSAWSVAGARGLDLEAKQLLTLPVADRDGTWQMVLTEHVVGVVAFRGDKHRLRIFNVR